MSAVLRFKPHKKENRNDNIYIYTHFLENVGIVQCYVCGMWIMDRR